MALPLTGNNQGSTSRFSLNRRVQRMENKLGSKGISPSLSLYFDGVRVTCAIVVMLAHAQVSGLIPKVPLLLDLAPFSVIVFFVLSGYIIEATTQKQRGLRTYLIHRAARVYSVVIPAVILSVSLLIFDRWAHGVTNFVNVFSPWWKWIVILSFHGEDWFRVAEVPWNGPFWSLHYEVTYYLLFGALHFSRGIRRFFIVVVLVAIAGPKIVILFPCWWLGVLTARNTTLTYPSQLMALFGTFAAPLTVVAIARSHVVSVLEIYSRTFTLDFERLDHSQPFLVYYVASGFIAAAFAAARQLELPENFSQGSFSKIVKWLSGFTFSIYLYHRPLQMLALHFVGSNRLGMPQAIAIQVSIISAILLLGSITERQVSRWRSTIDRLTPRRAATF